MTDISTIDAVKQPLGNGIGIIGLKGRMGQAIYTLLDSQAATGDKARNIAEGRADPLGLLALGLGSYVGGVDKDSGSLQSVVTLSDVLIDFSSPAALPSNLDACIAAGKPILIGTTGLEAEHHFLIDAAAQQIPVLQTGNTSLGVNLIAALVRDAASRLGPEWDIEIVEMHHRHKVDAPSGTALLLGEAAAAGRGITLPDHSERGRDGVTGARQEGAIGFAALRGGSVAGDHQVIFATDQERIEIGHRAENRTIFARGAVTGALWLATQEPGRYTMPDVLGL